MTKEEILKQMMDLRLRSQLDWCGTSRLRPGRKIVLPTLLL
jgi:hypothetical protein